MISHHYVDIYQAAFQALLRRYAHSGMTDVVEHEDQGRSTTAGADGRSESEGAAALQLNASIEILPSSSTSTSSGLPWLRSETETTVVTDAGGERGAIAGSSANSTPRSEDSSGSERGGTSSNGGIDERQQQQQQHPELVFFDSPRVTPKQRLGGADGTVAGEEGRQKRAFTPARRLQV